MGKLKVDDHVLIVTMKDKNDSIRLKHNAKIDKIKEIIDGNVVLKRYDSETFNDDGDCDNPKKKLIKIKPFMKQKILGDNALRGNLNQISKIDLDDDFFKNIKKDNENEN